MARGHADDPPRRRGAAVARAERPGRDRPPAQPPGRGRRGRDAGDLARGEGRPAVLLHGWLDNADTWLAVLDRLAVAGRPAIAYDLPGFGTAPPLDVRSVLDQLVDFAAAAVEPAAEASGARGGRRRQLARRLGGAAARRRSATCRWPGWSPIGPAGIRMAPVFFTLDRIPAVSRDLAAGAGAAVGRPLGRRAPLPRARLRRPRRRRPGGRRPLHPLSRRPPADPRADRVREAPARRARGSVRRRGDRGAGERDLGRARPPLPARRRGRARRAAAAGADRGPARASATRRRSRRPTWSSRRSPSSRADSRRERPRRLATLVGGAISAARQRQRRGRGRRGRVADEERSLGARDDEVVDQRAVAGERLGADPRRAGDEVAGAELRHAAAAPRRRRAPRDRVSDLDRRGAPEASREPPGARPGERLAQVGGARTREPVGVAGADDQRRRAEQHRPSGPRVRWAPRNGSSGSGTG